VHGNSTILDAGCGEYGLSEFVDAKLVVGVDIITNLETRSNFIFVHGSIVRLPLADRSCSMAASVDVLEHLPAAVRPAAVKELVRVASHGVLIAFPSGSKARRIDEEFQIELKRSNQPIPDWLDEHLQNPYPEAADIATQIEREAERQGRKVNTTVSYSEALGAAKFLRWSAARSRYLYMLGNLAMGLLLPIIPEASRRSGYRAMVLAKFEND